MFKDLIAVVVLLGLGTAFGYSVGIQSRSLWDIHIFWLLAGYAFALQILVFIPSAICNTERFFDLTGGLTFLSITLIATFTHSGATAQQYIAAAMVAIWAIRLSLFLFMRVLSKGEDSRFQEIKKSKLKFLTVWIFQGLWVLVTMSPLLVVMTKESSDPSVDSIGILNGFGIGVWALGLLLEVIADKQKSQFNSLEDNRGKFITTGLWSISRHPNYMGEIIIWVGASLYAIPALSRWEFLSLISPLFIFCLIMFVSGVNILEQRADKKWGSNADYLEYKRKTPVLFPLFCCLSNRDESQKPVMQEQI